MGWGRGAKRGRCWHHVCDSGQKRGLSCLFSSHENLVWWEHFFLVGTFSFYWMRLCVCVCVCFIYPISSRASFLRASNTLCPKSLASRL